MMMRMREIKERSCPAPLNMSNCQIIQSVSLIYLFKDCEHV